MDEIYNSICSSESLDTLSKRDAYSRSQIWAMKLTRIVDLNIIEDPVERMNEGLKQFTVPFSPYIPKLIERVFPESKTSVEQLEEFFRIEAHEKGLFPPRPCRIFDYSNHLSAVLISGEDLGNSASFIKRLSLWYADGIFARDRYMHKFLHNLTPQDVISQYLIEKYLLAVELTNYYGGSHYADLVLHSTFKDRDFNGPIE